MEREAATKSDAATVAYLQLIARYTKYRKLSSYTLQKLSNCMVGKRTILEVPL